MPRRGVGELQCDIFPTEVAGPTVQAVRKKSQGERKPRPALSLLLAKFQSQTVVNRRFRSLRSFERNGDFSPVMYQCFDVGILTVTVGL